MAIPTPQPPDPAHPIIAFNRAITTSLSPHPSPHRAFAHIVTFDLSNPFFDSISQKPKPPLHFHPYQDEYVAVLEGGLGLTLGAQERVLRPADGEICIPAWTHHRVFPVSGEGEGKRARFLLAGQQTERAYRLDTGFLQNWYGYQDEVVMKGGEMDFVQVLSMFDAGGSYLSLPWWVPFGRHLSMAAGIVVGRWIGSLLSYQPFYRQWTSDWDLACEKMRASLLQRRFADHARSE